MPDQTLNAAIIIKAVNEASGPLRQVVGDMKEINRQGRDWADTGRKMAAAGAVVSGFGVAGLYSIKKLTDAYGEWQQTQAHVATAMSDGAATAAHLAEEQKVVNDLASSGVVSNTALADSYYMARSDPLDHADALAAVKAANDLVIGTTKDAMAAQAAAEPVTRMLTAAYNVFGDKTVNAGAQLNKFADQFAKLQTAYGFKDITEVQEAAQYAMPTSKISGIDFASQNAALALLAGQGKYAAEAGTAYEEFVTKLTTDNKLRAFWKVNQQGGLDLGATLKAIGQATSGFTALQRENYLHSLGFQERSIQGVALLIDQWQKFGQVRADLIDSAGAANKAAQINSGTTVAQRRSSAPMGMS